MTVLLDTGLVVALYDGADADHQSAVAWVLDADEDLITTPVALAEMDYVVTKRGGAAGRDALYNDLERDAYGVRWWATGLRETLEIARRHPFAGLADASLVALAGILRTTRIATFDQNFRSITTPSGEPFVLLPEDA